MKKQKINIQGTKINLFSENTNESDRRNVALFGKTAQEWRQENPEKKGNIRDYANIEQLVILTNMEYAEN